MGVTAQEMVAMERAGAVTETASAGGAWAALAAEEAWRELEEEAQVVAERVMEAVKKGLAGAVTVVVAETVTAVVAKVMVAWAAAVVVKAGEGTERAVAAMTREVVG